ncbi:MAG: hypothetical protein KAT56_10645 [Sedimentisphaerales bacterium]|nr:hypothetical protein [Sedimentisphaerales bacterium]
MTKKMCFFVVIFLCVSTPFLVPGCQKDGESEQSGDGTQEPTNVNRSRQDETLKNQECVGRIRLQEKEKTDINSTFTSFDDIRPGIGIGPIEFGMTSEDVVKYFGEPEKTMNKGRSLLYPSKGFTLMVSPKRGVQMVNCYTKVAVPPNLSAKDFQGKTTEGIAMGATQSQIISAYGEPDSENQTGSQTELNYNKLGIRFILLNKKLVQFFMNQPRNRG